MLGLVGAGWCGVCGWHLDRLGLAVSPHNLGVGGNGGLHLKVGEVNNITVVHNHVDLFDVTEGADTIGQLVTSFLNSLCKLLCGGSPCVRGAVAVAPAGCGRS